MYKYSKQMPIKSKKTKKKYTKPAPKKRLSIRDMKFARLIAEGEPKVDAYYKAYNCKNPNRTSIKTVASKYSMEPILQAQIQSYKEEFAREADFASIITVDRQAKLIEKAILATQEKEDWNSYLKAIDMQSKLVGIYAPDRVETKNLHLVKGVPAGDVDV